MTPEQAARIVEAVEGIRVGVCIVLGCNIFIAFYAFMAFWRDTK